MATTYCFLLHKTKIYINIYMCDWLEINTFGGMKWNIQN